MIPSGAMGRRLSSPASSAPLGALLAVLASLATAGWARADVPPADTSGCRDKSAGATCKTDQGARGTCVTSQCQRMDRSKEPYVLVPYDCQKCVASADTTSGGSSSGGSSGGTSSGTTSSGGSASSGGSTKSGCASRVATSGPGGGGALVAALAAAAVVALRRSRRRP